jgi:uncharacterized membrane protein (Fun14 family)
MSAETTPAPQAKPKKHIIQHVLKMPRWQQGLLTVAIVTFGGGIAGQVSSYMSHGSGSSSPGSSFVGQGAAADSDKPFIQRISPRLTAVGLSFVVGFVIGWLMRTFMKMATMLTMLIIAIMLGLSYFKVLNVDLSKAEVNYKDAREWITDQGQRAGKALAAYLPSSVSALAGIFIGFRRK